MEAPFGRAPERMRVSVPSLARAVLIVFAVIIGLRVLAAAERVVVWLAAAAAIAGVLHRPVAWLGRRMPRGAAVAVVAVATSVVLGLVTYALADNVIRSAHDLTEAAPDVARRLEVSGPFAGVAREIDLERRTRRFVEAIPDRLLGGPAAVARGAADAALSVSIVAIFAIFFLLQGPALLRSGLGLLEAGTRDRVSPIADAALRRAFSYMSRSLLVVVAAAGVAYALAMAAGLPAPVPLALWVGLLSLVPVAGVAIAGIPLVALGFIASTGAGAAAAVVVVGLQVGVEAARRRWIERDTVRVGPFLVTAAFVAGLEWKGVPGAIIGPAAVAGVLAILDEMRPHG